MTAAPPRVPPVPPVPPVPRYAAERCTDTDAFLQRWTALLQAGPAHPLPFHSPLWLRSWCATLGRSDGREPLLLAVRRVDSGPDDSAAGAGDVMLLALCSRPLQLGPWRLRMAEFADATVVDYNAPLLAPGWAGDDPAQARPRALALWQAVRAAIAPDHEVLRLQKMLPAMLDTASPVHNPLALALPVLWCEMQGSAVTIAGDWDDWRHTLDKRVRKEFERSWRVFTRSPQARFERITDPALAQQAYAQLEARQAARMQATGHDYRLDQPAYSAFYRQLVEGGLADGSVVLTALRDGDTWVAVQLGVANGRRSIALRVCHEEGPWKACSPGRLSCERTGHHLWAAGRPVMDLGIGSYFHKAVFQGEPVPLLDTGVALSAKGRPASRMLARAWLSAWLLRQRMKRRANSAARASA